MTSQGFVNMRPDLYYFYDTLESDIKNETESLEALSDQVTTKLKANTSEDREKLETISSLVQSCFNRAANMEVTLPSILHCLLLISSSEEESNIPPETLDFFRHFKKSINDLKRDKARVQELIKDFPKD